MYCIADLSYVRRLNLQISLSENSGLLVDCFCCSCGIVCMPKRYGTLSRCLQSHNLRVDDLLKCNE